MALRGQDAYQLAGLLSQLPTLSGRPNSASGMGSAFMQMGQQARQEEQRKQAAEKFQGLLGQRAQINPYQQSEAEMFPGEQPIQGLRDIQPGSGLLGGEIGQEEFYGGLLSTPGYEQVGAQGLMQSMTPQQASWKLAEVGTPDGQMQRVAYNAADPTQMRPLGAAYEPRAATQVNVNQGGPTTPGWKKVDETFAGQYASWTLGGGFTDTHKQLAQLNDVVSDLESDVQTGFSEGLVPDKLKAALNPKLLNTKQSVEEVVQRNLREILGAQFTEKEGERLISRAFDDSLPTEVNVRRVKRLIQQIGDAAKAKQEAMEYFGKNGTMQGFQGKTYSANDFHADTLFGDEAKQRESQQTRTLGGKSYIKIDGQWYEQ